MGNEQSSKLAEPSPYASAIQTGGHHHSRKSSMRRSISTRQNANALDLSSQSSASGRSSSSTATTNPTTRYIPNMDRAGNGLNMPTRPYEGVPIASSAHSNNGTEMSPQWGWYINTTPPTPEMYHRGSKLIPPQAYGGVGAPPYSGSKSSAIDGSRHHNQVFRNLQGSNAPMGWTSVPI